MRGVTSVVFTSVLCTSIQVKCYQTRFMIIQHAVRPMCHLKYSTWWVLGGERRHLRPQRKNHRWRTSPCCAASQATHLHSPKNQDTIDACVKHCGKAEKVLVKQHELNLLLSGFVCRASSPGFRGSISGLSGRSWRLFGPPSNELRRWLRSSAARQFGRLDCCVLTRVCVPSRPSSGYKRGKKRSCTMNRP